MFEIEQVASEIDVFEKQDSLKKEVAGPKLLLVDDDPVFCRTMESTARKHGISLTVAKNMGDVLRLQGRAIFDAALLDFQFGDLTAYQVGHFIGENTPIVLVSGHSRAGIHFSEWPFDIRDFVAKSLGNPVILKRALDAIRTGI